MEVEKAAFDHGEFLASGSRLAIDAMVTMVQDFYPCMADELRARRGQKLRFLERQGHWVLVANVEGRTGYIPAAYCRPADSSEHCALQRAPPERAQFNARRSLRLSLGERCDIADDSRPKKNKSVTNPTAQEINAASRTLTNNGNKSATLKLGSPDDSQVFCSLIRLLRLSKLRAAFKAAHAAQVLRRSTGDYGNVESMESAQIDNALFVSGGKANTCTDFRAQDITPDKAENLAKLLMAPAQGQVKQRAAQLQRSQPQYSSPKRNAGEPVRRRLGALGAVIQSHRKSSDDSVLNLHDVSRDVFGQPMSGECRKAQAYSPREAHQLFEKRIAPIEESPAKRAVDDCDDASFVAVDDAFQKRMSLPTNVSFSNGCCTSSPATRWSSPRRSPKMQRSLTFNSGRSQRAPSVSSAACCSDSDMSPSSVGSSCSRSSFLAHDGSDVLEELAEESPLFEEPPIGSPSRQTSRRFLVLFDYTATAKEELTVVTGDIVIQARPRGTGRRNYGYARGPNNSINNTNNSVRGQDWAYVMKTSGGSGYVPVELLQTYITGQKDGLSATAL